MIKVELSYNPYLMELGVKFNGQAPKINSMIEKYQNSPLHNWINKIPVIFYDEMNGYDFELDFSGTRTDCDDLINAFDAAGVTKAQVSIFHKNELEDRVKKVERIETLLTWLSHHHNRKFDNTEFRDTYKNLFDSDYSFVTFHGNGLDLSKFDKKQISVENVESVEELKNTDLTNTPILFCINEETMSALSSNLMVLLKRADIIPEQLFFLIAGNLQTENVYRIICDLGVDAPQIVSDVYDSQIKNYFDIYPVTDYAYQSIVAFRREISRLEAVLEEENKQSEQTGKEIHTQIEALEGNLRRLKNSDAMFLQRDNIEMPVGFKEAEDDFYQKIFEWRIRKIKINSEEEAIKVANELNEDSHKYYMDFCGKIAELLEESEKQVFGVFKDWYGTAEYDTSYVPAKQQLTNSVKRPIMLALNEEFLELKEEKYTLPKDDILGKLFKSPQVDDNVPVLERTYYYQSWREHVIETVKPLVEKFLEDNYSVLQKYYDHLADEYHSHITELINEQTAEKDEVASQLSEDEKQLQIDNDWLTEFSDQLKLIERA